MIPLKYIISLLKKSCRIQQIVLLDEISNIMRSIPLRFRVELHRKHSLEKNVCISSSRMTASDSVSLLRLDTDGSMSDTPETMGGLSGSTNGTPS